VVKDLLADLLTLKSKTIDISWLLLSLYLFVVLFSLFVYWFIKMIASTKVSLHVFQVWAAQKYRVSRHCGELEQSCQLAGKQSLTSSLLLSSLSSLEVLQRKEDLNSF
jgi:hypothetical protein